LRSKINSCVMKQALFILILILTVKISFAQKPVVVNEYAAIDKKALQLPDSLSHTTAEIAQYVTTNFTTDKDRTRAIFIWVASNIQYDIENMFAINLYEKKEDKITKPLTTRKGICENYAALFNDICTKAGIKSYIIEGYTKQSGFTDYIPHAWCAARVDTTWYMFDPTWGSGYVSQSKFFKKINNAYYKVSPAVLIKSHMPFDYLWQFLNYPITNQEFYEGKVQINKSKPYFNYADTIQLYEKQSKLDQLYSTAYRVQKNGLKNAMIFDRMQHLRVDIENIKINAENERQYQIVHLYNAAARDYNDGIDSYNLYVNYKNKQFTPSKSDAEIQEMITGPTNKFKEAKEKLAKIQNPDAAQTEQIKKMMAGLIANEKLVTEEQQWLNVYFSKKKSGRKAMFYEKTKVTWFGVPLN
jgi:hypothetical protein